MDTTKSIRFDYAQAFARNEGWIDQGEQRALAAKRVAIAGMGGVGGHHLLTLCRLGVRRFNLADFDTFELANFNRQAGAGASTLGLPKVQVMAEQARDVNPEAEIRLFEQGVSEANVEDFLDDVDLFIDGIDLFAIEARRAVFAACTRLGIPSMTAAPLGFGVSLLTFLPGRMSFEEYFRLEGRPRDEQLLRFLIGVAPARLHMQYLRDPSTVDLPNERGPSTAVGGVLAGGVASAHAVKILLGRGPVPAAPRGIHFDAYRNRFVRTWRPGGNASPWQRLLIAAARKRLLGAAAGKRR